MMSNRIFNFSAGPAMMPEEVLSRAASEMLDYKGSGMSVMEMSHRGPDFLAIYNDVVARLKAVMQIPDNYRVLLLQGGATLQFSAVPLNLLPVGGTADYAVTGQFAGKAKKAADMYGDIRVAVDTKSENFARIPAPSELKLNDSAAYFHYCMNNTIFGTLWSYVPETGDVPLVSDISSCILSEPLDVSKFGLLYAGAQKNMGPAGLTVVIVREDLTGHARADCPDLLNYASQIKGDSMVNTPATYGIYLLGLVLEWIESLGGLTAMQKRNREKAAILYDVLDSSKLYKGAADKDSRSMMNVTFSTGSEELDAKFVKEAKAQGLCTLKGHRAVGGMRASIYNAMPKEGIEKLAAFMKEFEKNNG